MCRGGVIAPHVIVERDTLRATVERLTGELATMRRALRDVRRQSEALITAQLETGNDGWLPARAFCVAVVAEINSFLGEKEDGATAVGRALSSAKPPTDGAGKDKTK
jgi:hypothetical protein